MAVRGVARSVVVTTVLLSLSACGSTPVNGPKSATRPSGSPHAISTVPIAGTCRNLTFRSAAETSDATPTVPCTGKHTAVTVAIGSLVDKRHPTVTNVNSPAIQQRLAVACPKDVKVYVGGFNVGNEYVGLDEKFGYWRDTHLRVEGGAVAAIQRRFLMDWNAAADQVDDFLQPRCNPEIRPGRHPVGRTEVAGSSAPRY